MLQHLRACLWLLVLTVLLCCVAYPLSLWGIGQTVLRAQANGSIIYDDDGKAIGSLLIAQEFKGDKYFQCRPSATGGSAYNAAASGASNWGASNYLLRDRVAKALGPLVKYRGGPKNGQLVKDDIVSWIRNSKTDVVAVWAGAHAGLAQAWVKSEDAAGEYVTAWFAQPGKPKRAARLEKWREDNPQIKQPSPGELAIIFFESFAEELPGTWLAINDAKDAKGEPAKNADGKVVRQVDLVRKVDEDSADIAAVFFDLWRQEHPDVDLEEVPADLVTASASGLDPHITLKNALYQLDRVAGKWAETKKLNKAEVMQKIEAVLRSRASAPLFGLAGVEMVNVLEVNLAVRDLFASKKKAG